MLIKLVLKVVNELIALILDNNESHSSAVLIKYDFL